MITPKKLYPIVLWGSKEHTYDLKSDRTLEGFSYRSLGIPGIATSYSVGYVKPIWEPKGMAGATKVIRPKGAKDCVDRKTIGPVPLPEEPVDPVSFAFRLESLTRQAGKLVMDPKNWTKN